MANTPNFTLRVAPEHRDLVRAVVARFKSDTGFADRLAAFLADTAAVAPPDALAALVARVAALEARFTSMPAAQPSQIREHPAEKRRARGQAAPEALDDLGLLDALAPQAEQQAAQPEAPTASKRPRHNLAPEQHAEVKRLYTEGKRVGEIVKATGISQASVSRIIAAYRGAGPENRTLSGNASAELYQSEIKA